MGGHFAASNEDSARQLVESSENCHPIEVHLKPVAVAVFFDFDQWLVRKTFADRDNLVFEAWLPGWKKLSKRSDRDEFGEENFDRERDTFYCLFQVFELATDCNEVVACMARFCLRDCDK